MFFRCFFIKKVEATNETSYNNYNTCYIIEYTWRIMIYTIIKDKRQKTKDKRHPGDAVAKTFPGCLLCYFLLQCSNGVEGSRTPVQAYRHSGIYTHSFILEVHLHLVMKRTSVVASLMISSKPADGRTQRIPLNYRT